MSEKVPRFQMEDQVRKMAMSHEAYVVHFPRFLFFPALN